MILVASSGILIASSWTVTALWHIAMYNFKKTFPEPSCRHQVGLLQAMLRQGRSLLTVSQTRFCGQFWRVPESNHRFSGVKPTCQANAGPSFGAWRCRDLADQDGEAGLQYASIRVLMRTGMWGGVRGCEGDFGDWWSIMEDDGRKVANARWHISAI